MKPSKIFGMCIVLLLAAVSVHAAYNETLLDALLATYDDSYDNGGFTAVLNDAKCIDGLTVNGSLISSSGGNVTFNFTIGGSNANDPYETVLNFEKLWDGAWDAMYSGMQLASSKQSSSPGNYLFAFDGTYFEKMGDSEATYYLEMKIFQNGMLSYQKKFEISKTVSCATLPIRIQSYANATGHRGIRGINTNADSKFELANMTLNLTIPEPRYDISIPQPKSYIIGVYVWDNVSNTAYAEASVTTSGSLYYSTQKVTFIFNSTQFKDFKLNNSPILLKSVVVNGNILRTIDINQFNRRNPSSTFDPSDFTINSANIEEIYFDTSNQADGKITELGMTLNVSGVNNPPYNAEISLENMYGEVIGVKSFQINNDSPQVSFDGTDIYESKINGPYRVGFARIMKGSNEELYKNNIGLTAELSYSNFTAPPMADISVNDSDVIINGSDVDVTIHNQGTGDATGVTISLFDDNAEKVDEIIVDSLLSSADYSHTFSGVNLGTAYVMVDFNNIVEELNESNNVAASEPKILVEGTIYLEPNASNGDFVEVPGTISYNGVDVAYLGGNNTAQINLAFDQIHSMNASSPGYQPAPTEFYFDSGLSSCTAGTDCTAGTTSCAWDNPKTSWVCTGAQTTVFRLYASPFKAKISAALVQN